jgi:hypothetical protein
MESSPAVDQQGGRRQRGIVQHGQDVDLHVGSRECGQFGQG